MGELEKDFGDNLKIGLPFNDTDLNDLIEFGNVDWDKYESANIDELLQDKIFRLNLTFKGEDILLVKEKLEINPEQTIIELIKNSEK